MKVWLLITVLAMGAGVSRAQDAEQETTREHDGLNFTAPFVASGVRENNMQVGNTTINDYSLVLYGPRLALAKTTPITTFSISYSPDFQLFANHRDLNTWNHSAELQFSGKLTPRFTLNINDYALKTQDPTRSLGESVLILPRGDFRENVADVALEYRMLQNTFLTIGGNNTISQWTLSESRLAGKFTNMSTAGTAGITQVFRQRHRVSGSYAVLKIEQIDTPVTFTDTFVETPVVIQTKNDTVTRPIHELGGGYRYSKERGLTLELSGSWMRGGFDSYAVSGSIERHWRTVLIGGGYVRQISGFQSVVSPLTGIIEPGITANQLSSGVLPSNILQVVNFRFRDKFTNHFGIELRALAGRQEFGPSGQDVDSLTGRLRAYYQIAPRVSFFVGAESYTQNFNDLLGRAFSRQRYLGGVMISLGRREQPAETVAGQQEPERIRDIATEWPGDWGKE